MKKILSIIAIVLSGIAVVANGEDPVVFSNSVDLVVKLGKHLWAKDLKQIPATVIDNGVMRNIPYLSYKAGDYEFNVYGDPDKPAGVEIGIYRTLLNDASAKANCTEFISSILPSAKFRTILRSLSIQKDSATSNGLTIEITPPTDPDAYGGWWVSAYFTDQLDAARASDKEMSALTVPKQLSTANAQASGWTQADMKYSRPDASLPVEVSVPSVTIEGSEYKDARLVKYNPAQVKVYHSAGVGVFAMSLLSLELQKQLGYDPAAAQTYLTAVATQQRQLTSTAVTTTVYVASGRGNDYSKPATATTQPYASPLPSTDNSGQVYVQGYYRKNGTYVQSYSRRR